MRMVAINGSPRKHGNTATLLNKALEGASSCGAETELVNLYDLNFKGCSSCYACKLKNRKTNGKCEMTDDLSPVLDRVNEVDALVVGSPIYLAMMSGEMKSFLERFVYPYVSYSKLPPVTLFTKTVPIGFIYTMGVNENAMKAMHYDWQVLASQTLLDYMFGRIETLVVNDTTMFENPSRYETVQDVAAKEKRRRDVFPSDCQKAFEMGMRLMKTVQSQK